MCLCFMNLDCANVNDTGVDGEHHGATNEFQLISVKIEAWFCGPPIEIWPCSL